MTVTLANTPVLTTERLVLRAPMPHDWEHWMPFAMSERAQFIGGPYSVRNAWRGMGHVIGHWVMRGWGSFIITFKGDDRPIGMTGPWFPEGWPEKEIGWTIWDASFEGHGIAYEAAVCARDFVFNELGWDTAVSYIDVPNSRSIALAERLGAVHDPDAALMEMEDPHDILVYRHPNPKGSL